MKKLAIAVRIIFGSTIFFAYSESSFENAISKILCKLTLEFEIIIPFSCLKNLTWHMENALEFLLDCGHPHFLFCQNVLIQTIWQKSSDERSALKCESFAPRHQIRF